MKVGDIVEQINGPYLITSMSLPPRCGFITYQRLEGPPTKAQHKYRECERISREHREARVLALRTRIRDRVESRVGARIIPGSTSEEALKPLIDVIVELIDEESEY